MYKNYIISAWRHLKRASLHSVISIVCLTLGITGAIMVSVHLNHELSHDTHHQNHQRIYRMEGIYNMAGTSYEMAITPFPLALAMLEEFSEIEQYARFFVQEEVGVRARSGDYTETGFVYADSTVFNVFSHEFVHGNPAGALSGPRTLVLTQTLSEKYFGRENPVGQSLEVNQEHYLITGVIKDLPGNSHFSYDAMMSMASQNQETVYSINAELFWNINHTYTYIMLYPGQDIAGVLDKMGDFTRKYVEPLGETFGAQATYTATVLRDTHFTPLMMAPETGNKSSLLIFGLVALFLVIIAAINYTNLSTARSAKRAREIGIRKVSGASRPQLMVQFFSESLLMAVLSMILSLFLTELLWPLFNGMAGSSYGMGDLLTRSSIAYVLGITLFTGLAAGFYPALALSRIKPAVMIQGGSRTVSGSAMLRKALVVFQFSVSILLVTATLTVHHQLRFLESKPLGFDSRQRAVISLHGSSRAGIEVLEAQITQNPLILSTAKAFSIPGKEHNVSAIRLETETGMQEAALAVNYIDHHFLKVLNIPIVEGRGFEREMQSDVLQAAIVNRAAVHQYGWQDNPIGKQIQMNFDQEGIPQRVLRVVGVVEDFHFLNLKNPIEPQMLMLAENPSTFRHLVVEYQQGQRDNAMAFLESTVGAFDTSRLPDINPLTIGFTGQFEAEERQGDIFTSFALVTLLVSFLGLFGLSSFMTEQRKKEIGIRKVLGASVHGVLMMLYKNFLLLILLSIVISAPLSWWAMDRWLDGFLYGISMSFAPIALSAIVAFVVAMGTVTWHSLRAASANPVDSIRSA